MTIRKGYIWEGKFRKSVHTYLPQAFIYKILDTHSIEGLLQKLRQTHQQYNQFLVPKVPADFIMIHAGRTIWIECKNTTNLTSFPLANIKPHQLEFGKAIVKAGGEYFFAIQRNQSHHNRAFLVDIDTYLKMRDIVIEKGRKSIKWELFKRYGVKEMKIQKESLYDIKEGLE